MRESAVAVGQVASTGKVGSTESSESVTFKYRNDIDGLRAVSVIAVILFHIGWLPNGYLGVDIFFVISGYLITGIVRAEIDRGGFTFPGFYERRVRRILPLALFVTAVSLAVGMFVMLPDDLENLAQSVVATNLFANNVLQAITTKNYWDVVNEYKPLLHTWSLGIEEQFYLFWPVLLLVFARLGDRRAAACILGLTAISFLLFMLPVPDHVRFFYLPFRFFELASGGLVALYATRKGVSVPYAYWSVAPLIFVLICGQGLGAQLSTVLVVLLSCLVMASKSPVGSLCQRLMENRAVLYIGAISFSLYMWHQPVFAFARYAYFDHVGVGQVGLLVGATFVLSALSYQFIEQPFRRRRTTSLRTVLLFVCVLFAVTTSAGVVLHLKGGVVRDVPELDIYRSESGAGMHASFNHRVYEMNRDFESERKRVLVVGNSFARDWVNVLLESEFSDKLEVSYVYDLLESSAARRLSEANVVFFAGSNVDVDVLEHASGKPIFVVGPKNFGKSAGIFYNYVGSDYYLQRVIPDDEVVERNEYLRRVVGERYIDLIAPVADEAGTVPVFTPDGKFISQDCRHFTRAGATFYADILRDQIGIALGM